MRKMSAGNKTGFTIFTLIIISIIILLVIVLNKALAFEKEQYAVDKDIVTYNNDYEYVSLTSDGIIQKKWTGKYYLTEPETALSYDLGTSAVTYNKIKNQINLYGTFFEVALDGEVTKKVKNTQISNMLDTKLYKIEDRKYLIISKEISNESGSLKAENYLMVVIDKSGNTLLLNNEIDVKTINAIILETDTFKFDVANEKLIYEKTTIDLKKIIGSTNEYIEPEIKKEENEEGKGEGTTINVGGSSSQSSSNATINVGGTTVVNPNINSGAINSSGNISGGTANNNGSGNSNNQSNTNKTEVVKSVSLRSVTPGSTYIDVSYLITDPENKYQVVFLNINGGGNVENISLDKTKDFYRITGLMPNTDYTISLGYKIAKSDATVEEITEDILNVKTLKLQGSLNIARVTEDKIYFNLKIDKNSNYDNAKLYIYVNNIEQDGYIQVDINQAISESGWTSSIERTEDMVGKITLELKDVEDVKLTTSTQIY